MAASSGEFDGWLGKKLLQINSETDVDIFVDYIKGILDDGESNEEEQKEYIIDFLGQISEDGLEEYCNEIMTVWGKFGKSSDQIQAKNTFDEHLASAIEKNKTQLIAKVQNKPRTQEDEERRKAKQAILKQYDQVSDGEATDDDDGAAEDALVKNVNAKLVVDRQQVEREKNKQDSDKKKQKDKEDREKQKQKVDERKDAEKNRTQKGEKRR